MNNIAKTTLHIYQIRKNHNRKLLLLSLSQLDLKSHSFIILCEFAFSISSYCYYFLFRCSFIWLDVRILLLHFDWFMTGWMESKFCTFVAHLFKVFMCCRIIFKFLLKEFKLLNQVLKRIRSKLVSGNFIMCKEFFNVQ